MEEAWAAHLDALRDAEALARRAAEREEKGCKRGIGAARCRILDGPCGRREHAGAQARFTVMRIEVDRQAPVERRRAFEQAFESVKGRHGSPKRRWLYFRQGERHADGGNARLV